MSQHRQPSLNEGRGQNPGDTAHWATTTAPQRWVRSTKAGAKTPATRLLPPPPGTSQSTLNEGRGQNPGDTRRRLGQCCPQVSLNEGRGQNPGDTTADCRIDPSSRQRSTKAGAKTPATRRPTVQQDRVAVRSTKAGAKTPATHVMPSPCARGLTRSTKAGAKTPATRHRTWPHPFAPPIAQRRPGPKPRRHQ